MPSYLSQLDRVESSHKIRGSTSNSEVPVSSVTKIVFWVSRDVALLGRSIRQGAGASPHACYAGFARYAG
jgi:hypothetical protein